MMVLKKIESTSDSIMFKVDDSIYEIYILKSMHENSLSLNILNVNEDGTTNRAARFSREYIISNILSKSYYELTDVYECIAWSLFSGYLYKLMKIKNDDDLRKLLESKSLECHLEFKTMDKDTEKFAQNLISKISNR